MLQFQVQSKIRPSRRPFVVATLILGMAETGFTQSPTRPPMTSSSQTSAATPTAASKNSSELPMTQAQGAAILEELRRIEILLASRQPLTENSNPAPDANVRAQAHMSVEPGGYSLGRDDAPVVIVEFTDLECPVCQRFQTTMFSRLKADFIDTGKVRFITRDLPLPMHRYARAAAEAARCAGTQGKFWKFRDAVLSAGNPPSPEELTAAAREVGLDLNAFARCQQSGQFASEIDRDEEDAAKVGINGTPGFVVGRVANGWLDGTKWLGNRPYPFFQSAINAVLNGPASTQNQSEPEKRLQTNQR